MILLRKIQYYIIHFNRWFDKNLGWFFENGYKTEIKNYNQKTGS